jgi:hypothetical protein
MNDPQHCGTADHFARRTLLKAAGLSGLAWLTPVGEMLARGDELQPHGKPAKSVILLWLAGGPSQLETFDPHPGKTIAGDTKAISTSARGVQLAEGLPQVAEQMEHISLVRSIVSKEGDHERATYNVKTGYRPDPTVMHPSIGAVLCHQLPQGKTEIPRHVSIMPGRWPGRGGYLGDKFDAFKTYDPIGGIPDVKPRVPDDRFQARLKDLDVVEREFARGRLRDLEKKRTSHRTTIDKAVKMMSSEQLKAFNVAEVPERERLEFGDTKFGRGCLAAMRLIEVGVRCVEVTLPGWDTHLNNHEAHAELNRSLDPALATLVRKLSERNLLDDTIVICGGEFGRTPRINGADGRDHWPHGFSIALAGGGFRGGHVLGETDPEGGKKVQGAVEVADIHATVLHALGIKHSRMLDTPVGRPLKLSDGEVLTELLK